MKKSVLFFGALLIIVLGYYFLNNKKDNSQEQVAQEKAQVTEEKVINVGVLQLLSHPALDSIYKGMVEELARQGYEDGKNIRIDLQNAQGEQSNLALMSEKLVSEKNDILVGITTPATLSLANATKDIPIIMAGITYPVEAGLIASEEKPGNNITGVSDRTPIKQQLELMKEIIPNLKKIGLLYTSSEDNSIKQIEEAKKYAAELGLEVKLASIANSNDIQQVTESLASEVEAIFVPIDNTIASAMATVVKVTDKFKIGVFPSADTMVADGGVLGLGVDQYQIGVETAKVIVDVINGKKPADTPIVLANEGIIYLNEAKAQELGIEIPATIKEKAQIVK
ncbi:tryptophan ABC transporter substrate-binding protein [Fusobacterium pseudoperiodonticum]|uniref:tryptophan ABC transporter substrate-binding protein n=1 Tax=Fusobacterium pseudoperiodonticum TaxID=2663009 RepID=UPI0028EB2654|nr:tryptophan ABC transporter substrate-binding protein [Fusobacterium pseudoperiodonticum]